MIWYQKIKSTQVPLVLLILPSLTYFSNCAFSQDIIFADAVTTRKTHSTLEYSLRTNGQKNAPKSNGNNSSNGANGNIECEKLCIPLELCFSLLVLLENKTKENIRTLQEANCGYTDPPHLQPLVLCEDALCTVGTQAPQSPSKDSERNVTQADMEDTLDLSPSLDEKHIPYNPVAPRISDEALDLNDGTCGLAFPVRVHGGENAVTGEFPWAVALIHLTSRSREPQIMCGGALLNNQWVITAAHCVTDSNKNLRNISFIKLGALNISQPNEEGSENIKVGKVFFHPGFQEKVTIKHDIALIKLEKKATLSLTVGTICVPDGNSTTVDNSLPLEESDKTIYASIVGWGGDGSGRKASSDILQKTEIPLIRGHLCRRIFNNHRVKISPDIQICAGTENKDSCKGDSGGPLMVTINGRQTIIGVVSFGTIQCDGSLPGVYTRVLHYMNWVRETISNNSK